MSTTDSSVDVKQRLAEERTQTARQRTLLAEERTYSAWLRTGLASLATGFAIAKLVTDVDPSWLPQVLGALFIVVGGAMFVLAHWLHDRALRKLDVRDVAGLPTWAVAVITFVLLVGAAISLSVVFL